MRTKRRANTFYLTEESIKTTPLPPPLNSRKKFSYTLPLLLFTLSFSGISNSIYFLRIIGSLLYRPRH
jgi:hypothetical protein